MQIKADSFRWSMDSAGDWLCMQANDARQLLDEIKPGKLYDVTIKEHRDRRSLDANAYAWVLLDKLAERLRIPKTDLYRSYIREIGGNNETVCVLESAANKLRSGWEHNGVGWQTETMPSKINGCVNVTLYYGSSTYDTVQMSRLIDLIVQDCKTQGIETMTPQQLAALMEGWKCTR